MHTAYLLAYTSPSGAITHRIASEATPTIDLRRVRDLSVVTQRSAPTFDAARAAILEWARVRRITVTP